MHAAIGLLLCVVSLQADDVDRKRGAEVFKDVARRCGREAVAALRSKDPKAYDQGMKETKAKSEEELGDFVGEQLLKQHAATLALSETKAKELREGTFDDKTNGEVFDLCVKAFRELKLDSLPMPLDIYIDKRKAGDLKGLDLEFATRLVKELLETLKRALEKK